jgi:hypothetical protein
VQLLLLPGWDAVGIEVGVSRVRLAVVPAVAADVRVVALRSVREESEVTTAAQLGGRGASLLADGLGGGVPGSALLVGLG